MGERTSGNAETLYEAVKPYIKRDVRLDIISSPWPSIKETLFELTKPASRECLGVIETFLQNHPNTSDKDIHEALREYEEQRRAKTGGYRKTNSGKAQD